MAAVTVTPGTIGILTGRGPACDGLQAWLETLPAPPVIERLRIPGNQIAWQRDLIVQQLRPEDQWLLFVDADMVPPFGALERLLSHQLALVGGMCLERIEPFEVCAVKQLEPYERYRVGELQGKTEPLPVPALGTGFLLIRRDVFRRLESPWFRCGQIHPSLISEDLDFCLRAAAVGCPPYLDPVVKVGHETSVILWPGDHGRIQAQWQVATGHAPWRHELPVWDEGR